MNKIILMGRLTSDPEVKNKAVANYTLAVDRRYKKDDGQKADFIGCVCFGKNVEFVENFLCKGKQILVIGRLQVSTYEKDGVRHWKTEVIVDEHYFTGKKDDIKKQISNKDEEAFQDVDVELDEDLPF